MKDFIYPINYFDFTNGVDCSNEEINQWIDEGLVRIKQEIKDGIENPSADCRTGNSMMHINAYKQTNGLYTVCVKVSKSYMEHTECDIDLIND